MGTFRTRIRAEPACIQCRGRGGQTPSFPPTKACRVFHLSASRRPASRRPLRGKLEVAIRRGVWCRAALRKPRAAATLPPRCLAAPSTATKSANAGPSNTS